MKHVPAAATRDGELTLELRGEVMARQRSRRSTCGDLTFARGLNLSGEYVHIHSTALVESKDRFVELLKTGVRRYEPFEIEEVGVRVFGDCAVVTGMYHVRAFSRGRTIESTNRSSLVVARTRQGPRAVSFHATPIRPQ